MKTWLPILCFWLMLSACACNRQANVDITKADALYREGKFQEALVFIEKAEKAKPNAGVFSIKSSILAELGTCDSAVDLARKAITLCQDCEVEKGHIFDAFGSVWLKCNKVDSAIYYYQKALKYAENPSDSSATYSSLSAAFGKRNDQERAYTHAKMAVSLDSLRLTPLYNLGRICSERGRHTEGIHYLKIAIANYPEDQPSFSNLGFIYQLIGKYDSSSFYLGKAIELNPKAAAFPYNNRAYNKLQLGDLAGAMEDVNTSLELDNKNSYAYRNRALIWLAMQEQAKACADLDIALRLDFKSLYGDEVEKLKAEHCE